MVEQHDDDDVVDDGGVEQHDDDDVVDGDVVEQHDDGDVVDDGGVDKKQLLIFYAYNLLLCIYYLN